MGKPFTFISYARADAEFVLRLAGELRAKGVSIWLDKFDIKPGDDWGRAVDAALEACECFLLIVSPESIASNNVMDELTAAVEDEKRIVPLLYQQCRIPLRIRRLHYVDFTRDYDVAVGLLIETLGGQQNITPPPVEKLAEPKPEPKKPAQKPKPRPLHESFTEQLPDGVKLEMVAIPGGSFEMGSTNFDTSQPIHTVRVKPFHMGKYQVTQAQWKAVMGKNPSHFKGDTLPVEQVSWDDAKAFCRNLSEMTGNTYRLPSEAEWEYAARAGSTGDFCFGDNPNPLILFAWYKENSEKKTHPVGEKKPNAFWLYDVHGNVFEWCEDTWHESYKGAPDDGTAWVTGRDQQRRLLRGGSWFNNSINARAVYRVANPSELRFIHVGFRLVLSVRPSSL